MTSQGTIDPRLYPLVTGSSNQILNYQSQNPLLGYDNANPAPVAGISPLEAQGMGATSAAYDAPFTDAMALQAILRMPGAAGAGPVTGGEDLSGIPSLSALYSMLGPNNGQGIQPYSPGTPTSFTPDTSATVQPNLWNSGPGGGLGGPIGHNPNGNPNGGPNANPNSTLAPGGGVHLNHLPTSTTGPTFAASMGAPSATGPAWSGNEAVPYSHDLQSYADVMANPAQRRALAAQYTGPAFSAGQWGLPTFNGLQYTGADHEAGGNPAIAAHFQANGQSPAALAAFIEQGSRAASDYSTDPANIASHLAQGQDVWGNAMPVPAANRQTTALGRIINPGTNQNAAAPVPGTTPAAPAASPAAPRNRGTRQVMR